MASKKAPGRNVKEAERNTEAVKLRLDFETAADIEELSEKWGSTKSGVVEIAMALLHDALEGEIDAADKLAEYIKRAARG